MPKIVSAFRKRLFLVLIKAGWFSLCAASLVWYLYQDQEVRAGEAGIAFALAMLILTAPLGYFAWLVTALLMGAVETFLGGSLGEIATTIILWATLVSAGYFQWFVLAPALVSALWSYIRRPTH